ncbi:Hypothetical protein Minf_0980 [Methylacidiphilum infernorum V4]|uniref:Uncharacterized protein n=1 Tax=Methylacidiphilum infernorum (isolate V4) TaxID=481448 RepID=B3DUN2_METI4|nr:Hypothetical protein Minf_0980 [Methylacidiphilum infernorum V4]
MEKKENEKRKIRKSLKNSIFYFIPLRQTLIFHS